MLSPLPASKWNYATAAHLLNRAGFGGTPEQIQKLAAMSHHDAVDSLVHYNQTPDNAPPPPDWAKPDFRHVEKIRELQQVFKDDKNSPKSEDEKRAEAEKRRQMVKDFQKENFFDLLEMKQDWLKRMAQTSRPLQEKLTLFWHGHFATSAVKVKDAYYMWRQIDTFRRNATGNWLTMLNDVAKDPAMLIWLDQAQSQRRHPNENFAREVMELFSLGEGHYTEKDVTEAARAMTGWSLDRGKQDFIYRPGLHDIGVKTVLGHTGYLTGEDVLQIIVDQPQAARFITRKLWRYFGSENPDPKLIGALAENFRGNGNNFAPFLSVMFRSEDFYTDAVMRNQVKSPVQWLVNSVRLLQRNMPPPAVSTQMIRTLGQDLLAPPNVKGWDGGLSWITTNTLLARYNQAAILVMGQGNLGADGGDRPGLKKLAERANQMAKMMRPADVEDIIPESDRADKKAVVAKLEKRFIAGELAEKHRQVLRDYLEPHETLGDQDIRHAIRLIMSTPEYQLT